MAMLLPLLGQLSLSSQILSFPSSPPTPRLLTRSSFRLLLRHSKTLSPPLFFPAQAAISVPQDPIFLRHLQLFEGDEVKEKINNEDFEEDGLVDEEDLDPIRSFFKSREPVSDPKHEGGRGWHIEDIDSAEADLMDDEEETLRLDSEAPLAPAEHGLLGDILRIARNLPENSTLGDFMGSFVGKIGEGECVELLARMGEEGLAWSCLYLFEWMGLQEPSLVTTRACAVLFPVLGRAGMGEKLMIIFENLPRTKQFRDVRIYNAAISGLSFCSRDSTFAASSFA
ncbi:pentatricopeptide repeat-containing protein At5g50280, chloroplastic-like, partial [Phalaenopsis equestris]|uniref:pentatricopeptide repeat-containing protein At5g50280, chloroplastic-like n=1 Tax=Phalaenopsis equestris TaxID=78828 RepID=UPI0009E2BD17